MDDLAKISLTVYVSNFPSHLTIRELWNICGKKGTLMDVFIAKYKNKLGQMFAFCRFIKVSNHETLIDSLSNIWIGKLRLHANVASYFYAHVAKASVSDEVKVDTSDLNGSGDTNPPITLKHVNYNDFPLSLLNCYKDIRAIANSRILYRNEGFLDVRIKYLGGVPLRAWHNDTFKQICSKWDKMLFIDDSNGFNRLSKRLCVKSSHDMLVFATIMVSLKGISYTIRVCELCSWTSNFVGDNSYSDDEGSRGMHGQEVEGTLDDDHNVESAENTDEELHGTDGNAVKPKDIEPFDLDSLIQKKCVKNTKLISSDTPKFPPGFNPNINGDQLDSHLDACKQEHVVGSESIHNNSKENSQKQFGFSMLERLEETIKVGLALGFNMEGCENNIASLIAENGDIIVWGNSHFDFAFASARGKSRGIICLWNTLVFQKTRILCNKNYVVVESLWIPKDVLIMWIVVYAPHNLSSKIALWSSLANIIVNWNGNLMVMGDFNVVRDAEERFGSIFNERQSEIFNTFVSNTSLIDISLGGFNFTWTDKWGYKMSVVLEKGKPDHRSILLRESKVDYGPTPFRFFHSWLEIDGFHNLVIDTWKHDESNKLKNDHQSRIFSIDVKVDQGCATEEDFTNCRESLKFLVDINRREASELSQKAKIKWALEGDENSSFFHGSLKKRRRQLAITSILKNGDWIE
ncbi:RNA-directed DNA polymerase, eukaryota, partial [Tanacetum coccineum]